MNANNARLINLMHRSRLLEPPPTIVVPSFKSKDGSPDFDGSAQSPFQTVQT